MRVARLTSERAKRDANRVSVIERRWVVPAFVERVRDVADDRALQLELEVVPGRSTSVPLVEFDGLHVAGVTGIVVATMAEVDTADERHIVVGTLRTA